MPVPAWSLLKAGGFQAAGLEELGWGKGRAEGCVPQQPALCHPTVTKAELES